MLAAAGNDDLRGLVTQTVFALELVGNGLAQLRDAAGGSVLGKPVVERLDGRIFDVFRRIEVRFAGAEPDHVLSVGLHLFGLRVNGQCQRGRQRCCAVRNLIVHNRRRQVLASASWGKSECDGTASD